MSTSNNDGNEFDVNLSDHVYDGIQELDNPLPRWWLLTFYGAIAFSIPYFIYYSILGGPTLVDEYHKEESAKELVRLAESAKFRTPDEKELTAILADVSRRKAGGEVYSSKCASCHGTAGGGGIGPNLTDAYWLHGGKPAQIVTTITKGIPEKGMPPWGGALKPEEIYSTVSYIRSLHGTNPAGAKAPQGEKEE